MFEQQNPKLGIFGGLVIERAVLFYGYLVYFTTIRSILWQFGEFWSFGMFF
jgi:hypothetical protein